jgi:CRISPR-associated protein Cmr4
MQYNLYNQITKANTHVGSGQTNAGIVDNVVQRDLLSTFPIIQSTSLKGALKEWIKVGLGKPKEAEAIFGVEGKENVQATHYIFSASLLSFPMRSNKEFYFNVTCPSILKELIAQLETFDLLSLKDDLVGLSISNPAKGKPISLESKKDIIIEKHSITTVGYTGANYTDKIKDLFGDKLIIMNDEDFKNIVKRLPIITRNQLENGKSENLFYEEIVPRETHFAFVIGHKEDLGTTFENTIDKATLFQVGANATVGYGFCELKKII